MNQPELISELKTMPDADLLRLSTKRPEAFEELVNRYERQFVRKAISILRSNDEAYDVVQETFVRIYVAANRFYTKKGASFSSWAYTILTNQCYTAYTRLQKRGMISLDDTPEFAEIIPDQAGMDELNKQFIRDHLISLVSKLPLLLRRVVESHFIDGMPQQVIALQEGVPNNVIRARIHRAKKELQKLSFKYT